MQIKADKSATQVAAALQGVDGAVGVDESKWFVAIVNSRHEKTVAKKLQEMGIDSYVATQEELHIWNNGKRKKIDRVVIPSIVFVRCTEKTRREIVSLPFILRFMVNPAAHSGSLNRPVAVIPAAQISKLRFMLGHADVPVNFSEQRYQINDNVRIIRGSLKGLEGAIMKNPDGTHTLTIGIAMLGCATVKVDSQDVEKI